MAWAWIRIHSLIPGKQTTRFLRHAYAQAAEKAEQEELEGTR
jgi:hypothetical protein